MKVSEAKRWLAKRGCRFEEGTKHSWVILGTKRTIISRHMNEELKLGTLAAILKQLGLKERP
jgi:mRNA interferase HicA